MARSSPVPFLGNSDCRRRAANQTLSQFAKTIACDCFEQFSCYRPSQTRRAATARTIRPSNSQNSLASNLNGSSACLGLPEYFMAPPLLDNSGPDLADNQSLTPRGQMLGSYYTRFTKSVTGITGVEDSVWPLRLGACDSISTFALLIAVTSKKAGSRKALQGCGGHLLGWSSGNLGSVSATLQARRRVWSMYPLPVVPLRLAVARIRFASSFEHHRSMVVRGPGGRFEKGLSSP